MKPGKIVAVIAAGIMCSAAVVGNAAAQNSCRQSFQFYCGDKLVPGSSCENEGSCLAVCTVKTIACEGAPPCLGCHAGNPASGGAGGDAGAGGSSPINLSNGNTTISQNDLTVAGLGGGLRLNRSWNSIWPPDAWGFQVGMFGLYWRSSYEENVFVGGDGFIKYLRADGGVWTFGVANLQWPVTYGLMAPANGDAQLSYDGALWTLAFKTGEKRVFDGTTGHLLSIADRNGNTTQLSYDTSNRLTSVTDAASRHLYFAYTGSSSLVTGVSSDAGIALSYTYDQQRLVRIARPDQTTLTFLFDNASRIAAVLDSQGKPLETHTYDIMGRGLSSSRANGVNALTVIYPQ